MRNSLVRPSLRLRGLLVPVSVALLQLTPSPASAQGLVTFTTGFRGQAGSYGTFPPGSMPVGIGPLFGLGITPLRWSWGAAGVEASWAPQMTQTDSGAYSCFDPPGQPNQSTRAPCGFFRTSYGESTVQAGATLRIGPEQRRFAPFGELAVGYYRTSAEGRQDIWDLNRLPLANRSYAFAAGREAGPYVRLGFGVQGKPWNRGPRLAVSARYRAARLSPLSDYPQNRHGFELVLGVRF